MQPAHQLILQLTLEYAAPMFETIFSRTVVTLLLFGVLSTIVKPFVDEFDVVAERYEFIPASQSSFGKVVTDVVPVIAVPLSPFAELV